MGTEEKDGNQPRQRKRIIVGQKENMSSQERKPAYHAGRDGSGYQVEGSRAGTGKRPRINKDNQRVNYGHQEDRGNYQSHGQQRPYRSNDGGSGYGNRDNQSSYGRRPNQDGNYRQSGNYNQGGNYRQGGNYNQGGNYRQGGNYGQGGNYRQGGGNYGGQRSGGDSRGNRPSYGGNRGGGNYQNRRPQSRGDYNPNAKYSHQKQLKYKEALTDPNEPIRLNKFLANAGVCSRREADEFIQAGVVKVNDQVITELGTKITRSDKVTFHDQPVQIEAKLYILLNKPKNCVTTSDDPQGRLTVMDLVKNACEERIYPVGRLDRNTTGVLLLTNDGNLASKLTHPSFKKKKIYHLWLDKDVTIEDMEKLANGIELEDGEIHADAISYANEDDRNQVGIEIHSGRNRIVRRMFESLGYHVTKLDRVYFAGLTKRNLPRGKWRYLNEQEVNMLRMGAFE